VFVVSRGSAKRALAAADEALVEQAGAEHASVKQPTMGDLA